MTRIVVCPLNAVAETARLHQPSHVVTLLGPTAPPVAVEGIGPDKHLRLCFNDISVAIDGLIMPGMDHAEGLLGFMGTWERERPILIHCWAGISRSTAAAYVALCMNLPDVDERTLALRLRRASPTATPNKLIVAMADDILGRGGRMVDAVDVIGRGREAGSGQVFQLELTGSMN
jgi:predicted protein tyrosine phosphatase